MLWAYSRAGGGGGGKTKWNAGRKEAESGRSHVTVLEPDVTLPGKPQPGGNTQINGDGLN